MKLYIMRHGETDWNKQGLIQGSADIPLNEYGVELAIKTRAGLAHDHIRFDKVFSSPYIRAKRTAEILLEGQKVPLIIEDRIREMSFGKYEGIIIRELRTNPEYTEINKCFDDPLHYIREEGAESYEEVFARIKSFFTDTILPLEQTCENILMVSHGALIRACISIIKNQSLEEYWSIHQQNCSINIVEVREHVFTILEENRLYYDYQERKGRRFV